MCHLFLLIVSLVGVCSELRVRAFLGQWGVKDLQVAQGILAFWFSLERYSALVLLVSGLHFLTPLEAELMDIVEVHSGISTNIVGLTLTALACSLGALGGAYLIFLSLG
jgi:hypothetical protein